MADITGAWLGTYWQKEKPTRFEATMVQSGNKISGSILDDGSLGEAHIAGEVVGRVIQFTKRYVTSSPIAINYTGEIAQDEQSMQGTWQISGSDSGQWEAHRSGDNLLAQFQMRQTEQLSLTK